MPSPTDYKRLVIVDPQLKDQKGHNYRYAQGITAELGLPAVVLAHSSYHGDVNREMDVRPCLTFDQYNNSAFTQSYKPTFSDRIDRHIDRISARVVKENALWPTDSALGKTVQFTVKLLSILAFVPALIYQLSILVIGRGSSGHRDTTALALKKVFTEIKLGAGDLLVFQTMLWPTFESLLELRIQGGPVYACNALFIVHEDWLIYNTGFVRFTPARFEKRVLQALPFSSSKVVSTNRPLSEFSERNSGYFPQVVKEIEFPVDALPSPLQRESGAVRILIPGVYRGDKNFECTPALIEEISEDHPNAQFTVHESVMARVALPSRFNEQYSVYSDVAGANAWLEFLNQFDMILLPYGEAYRHRISGIIHEARLLGLAVVCHQGIADAALLAKPDYCFSDEPESAAAAVSACCESNQGTAFFKEEVPPSITEILTDTKGWIDFTDKPIAVQIKPAWTRCGTSVVLDAQMDYLVDRNFFVIELYLKTEPWLATTGQVEFLWQVMRGGREFSGGMVVRVLLKDVKLFALLRYLWKLARRRIPAFFKRENIHGTWCIPDPALQKFMRTHKVEVALVNHVFNSDFAFKHIPAKYYVCETHDIQINQLLMRRPELMARYESELKYELDTLGQFNAVVNLNRSEHKLIENHLGEKAGYVRPPIVARPLTSKYRSLADLLEDQSTYEHLKKLPEKFDLLIVGDGHPANVESAQSFIENVYPELPRGTTLGIIGKLCLYLEIDWHDVLNIDIHSIGFLEQLCNIYDFTSLLVLPDVAGEGIPIKTDEAIANSVPFVATKHALRGFTGAELSGAGIGWVSDDIEMTRQINTMLADPQTLAASRDVQSVLCVSHSMEQYFADWDQVLSRLDQP